MQTGHKVRDVITTDVVTVDLDTAFQDIAAARRVLPRTDRAVAADVARHLLNGGLDLPPGAVSAEVTDGVVVLRGRVARRSMVPVALALVSRVSGVADVVEHLAYAVDDTEFVPDVRDVVGVLLPQRG
jgi:osmotically-inducible protein OsmY